MSYQKINKSCSNSTQGVENNNSLQYYKFTLVLEVVKVIKLVKYNAHLVKSDGNFCLYLISTFIA